MFLQTTNTYSSKISKCLKQKNNVKVQKISNKKCHNSGTPNNFHRSRIILEKFDTQVDPHTNQHTTLYIYYIYMRMLFASIGYISIWNNIWNITSVLPWREHLSGYWSRWVNEAPLVHGKRY